MVNPRWQDSFLAIELNRTYRVVANNFIGEGFDGYDTFGALEGEDTFLLYSQTFVDWVELLPPASSGLSNLPSLLPISVNYLSTQSYTGPSGCNHTLNFSCPLAVFQE